MKRTVCFPLTLLLVLTFLLSGCGQKTSLENPKGSGMSTTEKPAAPPTEAEKETVDTQTTYTCDFFEYKLLEDATAEITKYTGSALFLDIPSDLDGHTVTGIGEEAFFDCDMLESVTIPDTVKYIKRSAFFENDNLKKAVIGNGTESIGVQAFSYSDKLEEAIIGNSVTEICDRAFWNCSGLVEIAIPDSVESIGSQAFDGCKKLESITVGKGLKSVGDNAFLYCEALNSVIISDVSAWCNIDFYCEDDDFVHVKDEQLPPRSNPLSYAHNLYLDNELVTDLIIPDDAERISEIAFMGCSSIKSVTIGNSVKSVERFAFWQCTELTDIRLSASVTSLGSGVFRNCPALKNVDFGKGLTSIPEIAFFGCSSLSSLTIPESVKEIGDYAFFNCTSLDSVTVPKSVTMIHNRAFGFYYEQKAIPTFFKDIKDSRFILRNESFRMNGYADSDAQRYAAENGFSFTVLS